MTPENTLHIVLEVDFASSRSHAKLGILKLSQSAMLCSISNVTILPILTRAVNVQRIKRAKRVPYALVHFVTARVSLFTDHRRSGLPMRAK